MSSSDLYLSSLYICFSMVWIFVMIGESMNDESACSQAVTTS